jgi:hypothetical protein
MILMKVILIIKSWLFISSCQFSLLYLLGTEPDIYRVIVRLLVYWEAQLPSCRLDAFSAQMVVPMPYHASRHTSRTFVFLQGSAVLAKAQGFFACVRAISARARLKAATAARSFSYILSATLS